MLGIVLAMKAGNILSKPSQRKNALEYWMPLQFIDSYLVWCPVTISVERSPKCLPLLSMIYLDAIKILKFTLKIQNFSCHNLRANVVCLWGYNYFQSSWNIHLFSIFILSHQSLNYTEVCCSVPIFSLNYCVPHLPMFWLLF